MRLISCAVVLGLASVAHAEPHEFIADAKALLVVGACADGPVPAPVKQDLVDAHCKAVRAAQDDYTKGWLALAEPFFAKLVPKDVPSTVVYPFAGGDLSTALTVFPDAYDITTMSLEPAGDATALSHIADKDLKK